MSIHMEHSMASVWRGGRRGHGNHQVDQSSRPPSPVRQFSRTAPVQGRPPPELQPAARTGLAVLPAHVREGSTVIACKLDRIGFIVWTQYVCSRTATVTFAPARQGHQASVPRVLRDVKALICGQCTDCSFLQPAFNAALLDRRKKFFEINGL